MFLQRPSKKKSQTKENTKNNDDKKYEFFQKIKIAFDEQLCFFDEEIPLTLSDFQQTVLR